MEMVGRLVEEAPISEEICFISNIVNHAVIV
jgi:hypothetical protein